MLDLTKNISSGNVLCIPEEDYYKMVVALRMISSTHRKAVDPVDISAFRNKADNT